MTQNAEMELKKQIQRQIRAVSSVGSHNNKLTTAEVTVGANLLKPNIPSPLASSSKTRTTADTVAKKISGAESFDDNLHAKPRKVQFDVIEDKSKGTLKQPNNGDVLMESFSAELFQRAGNALKVSLKDAGGHRSSFDEPQHQEIPVRSEPSHSARTRSEDKSAQLCKCKSCTLRREGAIQDVPKVVPAESIERRISRKTATSAAANQTGKSAGQKSPVKSAKPRETAKVGVKVNKIKLHPSAYSKVPIESRNRPPVPDLLVDITTKTEMVNSSPKLAQKKLESNSPVVGRNSRPYVPTVAEKPKSMSPAAIRNVKPTTSGMPSRKSQDSVEENVNWSFVALNFVENGRNRPAENSHETVEFPAMGEAEGTKDETCCNSFLFLEMPSEASDPNKQVSFVVEHVVLVLISYAFRNLSILSEK